MPTLGWNTEQAEQASKQSRPLQVAHGEGRVLQHALKGEPLSKVGAMNQHIEGSAPAAHYNGYAAYKDPNAVEPPDRTKRCKANDDTCMGWATSSGFCRPHSVGVAESFKRAE